MTMLVANRAFPANHARVLLLWVPKTCATWADALQIAVGSVPRSAAGRTGSVRPEMG